MTNLTSVDFDPFAEPAILRTAASTESQRELWTASRMGADASLAFNEAVSVRLSGRLDRGALEKAMTLLVASHEALHASFSGDGTSMLVEEPHEHVVFEDLRSLAEPERAERVRAKRAAQVTTPFDLASAPLIRASLLAVGDEEHLLLLSAHHIVCDGWSMAVMLTDLADLYTRCVRAGNGAPPLPLERPRFSDYAEAERQFAATAEHRKAERYWLDRFVGQLPVVDLPSDRARPPVKTYTSDRVDHVIGPALVVALKELSGKRRASFFATMLAGFVAFVHRLTGVEDLVVGVPAAGQSFADRPNLVGHCVNMLPVRTSPAGALSFGDLLSAVRRDMLDAYEHQQLTFGALLRKLAVPRDASRLPLITLSFNLDQAVTGEKLAFEGLRAEVATTPRAYENFDLFINAAEKHDAITLETQYNTDLFDRRTVERWLASFEVMLGAIAAQPDAALGDLLATTDEERRAFDAWNAAAARDYPRDRSLAHFVTELFGEYRDQTAVHAADGALSYADLDRRSRALATELGKRGIGRGARVGVSLTRSSHLLVAVLGILRSGAAYVPLDPSFPRDRLEFMVEDSGLGLLVSERKMEAELPSQSVPRLFLEDVPADPQGETIDPGSEPNDPAYVIYTSGSTGKPKGVVVPQGAVINFLRSMEEAPGFARGDRFLAVTTLSFDISVLELLLPLRKGGTVILATSTQAADGAELRRLLEAHDANVMQGTPATWRLVLGRREDRKPFRAGFKALCGGEALPRGLAEELLASGATLWNMYGPTETTVWSTCQQILPGDARIRVGKPIANTQIHIVDSRLRPVPLGVTGELCIAGDGVALGYHNRPELTAERFVENPFGRGRLYRTGDLGRWLADGTLECLGRSDGQVKVRGYRIELGEIETVLGRHAGVRQVVVVVREDRPGDQRLVAYVVPREAMPETDALRRHLKQTVPDYMVPQHFVEMTALPLTPNGKVDKKRLPAPVISSEADGAQYVAPATPTEERVEKIWQKILGVERVSTSADFFHLGGHSLLAAQVVSQVLRETGVEVSLRKFFETPSIAGLARTVDATQATPAAAKIPRNPPGTRTPLSPMQQRLWFMEELNPSTAVYNLPSCFRLHGTVDVKALGNALNAIIERHDVLRTTLGWGDGDLRQSVMPKLVIDLAPVDLRGLGASEREEKLLAILHEEAAKPFDLTRGPLVRASLYLLGPSESVFFFMPHHAVWDGWSFDIFLDELDRLYAAFTRGAASPLAPLEISYGDYAVWQRNRLAAPEFEEQTRFWTESLAGELPVLELPLDAPRPPSMTFAGATEPFEIDSALVTALSDVGKKAGATLYMVLLAAFDVLLHRLTGQTDIIVGTPVRGRGRPELDNLLGYFVNALALRIEVKRGESFEELLARVRTGAVDSFGHQEMPFEVLVQKLHVERDTSRTPIYSAFFTFQDVRNRKSSVGDLAYEQIHVHPPVSPTDLSFWVKQLDSGIVGGIDYATDIFQRDTARRWLAELQELLHAIVREPGRAVAELSILPAEELLALEAVSATARPYPTNAFLHQLIEAQVDRTPDATAMTFESNRLTYRELDARANRVAKALIEAGVGPGQRVGVHVERSLDLVVAALGVLKSGAAYVPLDPAFPPERIQFMVEDAGLAGLIVHAATRADAPSAGQARVLDLGEERFVAAPDPQESRPPAPAAAPADTAAYVIYTSGSTGKPKGVMVPHRAVVNFVTSMVREPGIRPDDRLLAVTTLSFDIAVLELWAPLVVGASVVVAASDMIADGDLLDEAIDEHAITVMQATPSTWRLLLGAGFRGRPGFRALCGGEPFPRDLAERLLDVAVEVWNLYGPTETTVWSTLSKLERPLREVLIGRPIANTSVHVVDEGGGLAPWGAPGELWIGGDGVALGYHARPDLTEQRFVKNPFRPGKAYRTGDIVRLRAGGSLEFLRRNDNQVKLRGFRIELGEIESALGRIPGVGEPVALVREDRPGDRRLVAYFVARGGAEPEDAFLRKELRAILPEYMIPQHFVPLERMPLTPNGKIDRRALPSPAGATVAGRTDFVPPQTDKERVLARLWEQILGVPNIGAHDNFFDLGGHSLLCLQMTAKLAEKTGIRLNPRIILLNDLSQVAAMFPELPPPSVRPMPPQQDKSLAQKLFGRLLGR
jgi:amino acid adenylation domain-containing protein